MTTEQAEQTGPCDETRCETCGERTADRPEHESDQYTSAGPPYVRHLNGQIIDHEARAHVHVEQECSARFYVGFYGVESFTAADMAVRADPIYSPESPKAWLAMRDVLAEIERRDWTAIIETASTPGDFNVILLGGDDGPNCPPLATVHNEPAPRAVALAAWAASSSSEALAEGEGENEGIALMLGLEPCDGWVVTNFGSAGGAMLQKNCAHDRCYSTRTVGNMNGTIGGVPDYLGSTEHLGEGIARVFERGWGYSVVADELGAAVTIYEPDTNVWREGGPTLQAAFWGALKRAEGGQW